MTPEKYAPPARDEGPSDRWAVVVFVLSSLVWLAVASALIVASLPVVEGRLVGLDWFDPFFFQYNVLLALFAILIVPAIVYFYVRLMKAEKRRRLRQEMEPEEWARVQDEVLPLIQHQFRFRQYLGSLSAVTFVIAAGVVIMLLMKPYFPLEPSADTASIREGVDFGRGANILMLGPFIESYPGNRADFYHQVVIGLTAFQFGFLGAYVYFITALLRSYFTLDLSTHTLVAGTIRMATSSVLALVLSFSLPALVPGDATDPAFLRTLPVFAFFIGYFPSRGLLFLEKLGSGILNLGRRRYRQTPLGELTGMSAEHETRLEREGYDNVENLAHAQALDLAVRTGFGYRQLRSWIGEARLRLALREDFETFTRRTWLRTEDQVRSFYAAWDGPATAATGHLAEACGDMEPKIRNLALLLGCESPEPAGP